MELSPNILENTTHKHTHKLFFFTLHLPFSQPCLFESEIVDRQMIDKK